MKSCKHFSMYYLADKMSMSISVLLQFYRMPGAGLVTFSDTSGRQKDTQECTWGLVGLCFRHPLLFECYLGHGEGSGEGEDILCLLAVQLVGAHVQGEGPHLVRLHLRVWAVEGSQ